MRNKHCMNGLKWDTKKSFWHNYRMLRGNKTLHFAHSLLKQAIDVPKIMSKAMRKERSVIFSLAEHAVHMCDTIASFAEDIGDDFFDTHGWTVPFSTDFSAIIYDLYRTWPKVIHEYNRSNCKVDSHATSKKIAFVEIAPNVEIGWEELSLNQAIFYVAPVKIYCAPNNVLVVRDIVAKHLWERFKNASVIIAKRVDRKSSYENDDYDHSSTSYLSFTEDEIRTDAISATAEKIVSNYKKALSVGLSRSLMLEGPPGTGKSTMAQSIIKKLNLRALRICVEDIDEKFIHSIKESVMIFKPSALIIDDFDRVDMKTQHALLDLAEWLATQLQVTIVTANDKNALDQALLRPGRFDEIVLIKTMDESAIRALLGEYADEAYEFVKEWPVAFINEYCKRRKYCSAQEAQDSLRELEDRVKKMFEAYDDNETEMPFINKRRSKF